MTNLYKPKVVEIESQEVWASKAAEFISDRMFEWQHQSGLFRMALAGGSTPWKVLRKLVASPDINWSEIELYQTDERITTDAEYLNQHLIKENLKDKLDRIKELNLFKINLSKDEMLADYANKLDSLDGNFFDLCILGIGGDGHFASIFPGNRQNLGHNPSPVILTTAPDYLDVPDRVSLTTESILNSQEILVLLQGSSKENILTEILEGNKSVIDFPSKVLLTHPNVTFVVNFREED